MFLVAFKLQRYAFFEFVKKENEKSLSNPMIAEAFFLEKLKFTAS